ncbi:group III truncated hemoglobin [Flavobacterium sp.]|uniref:group III truncated hemoglobin n=1 Tax=Flavobacterium sp. TaxID=239 RepID=UPI0026169EDE|nr:group III truncated hemoglobin [Flavobacterium sp.]MDD2985308.1 group III truncated hemoglobin [Flavobacterium sp.]
MKKDIQNRDDIIKLVDAFYIKVKADDLLGNIFTDVVHVNWETHLPRMYDFWENILFCTGNFDGNPMMTHKALNQKKQMDFTHFNRWNSMFKETVDSLFKGEKATEIKNRAMNISKAMMDKALS